MGYEELGRNSCGFWTEVRKVQLFKIYGAMLAEEIGLANIREKCPRFNTWIENLETI